MSFLKKNRVPIHCEPVTALHHGLHGGRWSPDWWSVINQNELAQFFKNHINIIVLIFLFLRKMRLEFERQKVRNRDMVNRWRTRIGRHRTVHYLDRSERIRSENRTIEDKLEGMVREVLVMKVRFEDLLLRHKQMMQSSAGKKRLLPDTKITEIENWLAQVPGMLQKVAESQATPARDVRKLPASSETLVRESLKFCSLLTQKIPASVSTAAPSLTHGWSQ